MRFTATLLIVLAGAAAGCATLPRNDGLHDAELDRLYLGRGIGDTAEVTDSAWTVFLREVVNANFPEGSTAWGATGQWRRPDDATVSERSFVLELVHEDTPDAERRVQTVIVAYKRRFAQQSVLRVLARVQVSY